MALSPQKRVVEDTYELFEIASAETPPPNKRVKPEASNQIAKPESAVKGKLSAIKDFVSAENVPPSMQKPVKAKSSTDVAQDDLKPKPAPRKRTAQSVLREFQRDVKKRGGPDVIEEGWTVRSQEVTAEDGSINETFVYISPSQQEFSMRKDVMKYLELPPLKPKPANSSVPESDPAPIAEETSQAGPKSAPRKRTAQSVLREFQRDVKKRGGPDVIEEGWTVRSQEVTAEDGSINETFVYISPSQQEFLKRRDAIESVLQGNQSTKSRIELFQEAQQFQRKIPVPFISKSGNLTVQSLGSIVVDKVSPWFHETHVLYPLGFQSEYFDEELNLQFKNQVDAQKNSEGKLVPLFKVRIPTRDILFTGSSPLDAWKKAKTYLLECGSSEVQDHINKWDTKSLGLRFGLSLKEVRKILEGLQGVLDCSKYKFTGEEPPRKKAVSDSPLKDSNTKKKSKGKQQEKFELPTSDPALKKLMTTGYSIFAKKRRAAVKSQHPEMVDKPTLLRKLLRQKYAELPESERQKFEKQAFRVNKKKLGSKAIMKKVEEAQKAQISTNETVQANESDSNEWRTDNQHVGKPFRRFIYDRKSRIVDAADGVVIGWLPAEESDYTSEVTGEPSSIWRLKYDDEAMGNEDLEEPEVIEAIKLYDEELPENVREKYDKRKQKVQMRKEKKEKRKIQLQGKMAFKLEREKVKSLRQKVKDEVKQKKELHSMKHDESKKLDESMHIISIGPDKGKVASSIKKPLGSADILPIEGCEEDFFCIYQFIHDLAAPLGASKMSYDDLLACFVESRGQDRKAKDNVERFYELARWLSSLATRSQWVRDDDEVLEDATESDVVEIQLANGPLLSSDVAECRVKYNVWQLLNETCWPEMVRLLIKRHRFSEIYENLYDALGKTEPKDLSIELKIQMIHFLTDEACSSDKVHHIMNQQLRQVEKIVEKKKAEDAALKQKKTDRKDPDRKNEDGEATETSQQILDLMCQVSAQDNLPFEIRCKQNYIKANLKKKGDDVKLVCGAQEYSCPFDWVREITGLQRSSVKKFIMYSGRSLKAHEDEISGSRTEANDKKDKKDLPEAAAASDSPNAKAAGSDKLDIDANRRKREFRAALGRVERILRSKPVGYDRWWRSYWDFEGNKHSLWVREQSTETASLADAYGQQRGRLEGVGSKPVWSLYRTSDGSLQALFRVLMLGPQGTRESHLIENLRRIGFDWIVSYYEQAIEDEAEVDWKNLEAQCPVPTMDDEDVQREIDSYAWSELPAIGDLLWAKSDGNTRLAHPIQVVEPVEEEPDTESEDEMTEEDAGVLQELSEGGWQRSGSEHINRRVLVDVDPENGYTRRRSKLIGRVVGWLPASGAEGSSKKTRKVALWRVKFDDQKFGFQDFEQREVEASIRRYDLEMCKKPKRSECLSSSSMFGQKIVWVYGKLFDEARTVKFFPLADVLPFQQFKEQKIQEIKKAGSKIMKEVEACNDWIEENVSEMVKDQDLRDVMVELGWRSKSEQVMSDQLKASCKHCTKYPRVLNVIQDNREFLPLVCDLHELSSQLLALNQKILLAGGSDDNIKRKLSSIASRVKDFCTAQEFVSCLLDLERFLSELANSKGHNAFNELTLDLDEWKTEGHDWIDRFLYRSVEGALGVTKHVKAQVVGWLPEDESEYQNSQGEPSALWHIVWEDGTEEDLEAYEVTEGFSLLADIETEEGSRSGMWDTEQDRSRWLKLLEGSQTVAAIALGMYMLGDRALALVEELCKTTRHQREEWDDYCLICFEGGNLICCDSCPRTVHAACLGLTKIPKGDFYCFDCEREHVQAAKSRAKKKNARGSKGKGDGKDKSKNAKLKYGDELQKLRKSLLRWGAINGAVAEVQPDEKSVKREERWYVQVTDGHVIKDGESGKLTAVKFFSPWRSREGKGMRLDDKEEPLDICSVLGIGSMEEMLVGDERKGYQPKDL